MDMELTIEGRLRLHELWLADYKSGARFVEHGDLTGANLTGADLRGANLRRVNLRLADISSADLSFSNLTGAVLCGAKLRDACLYGARIDVADISGADLRGANIDFSSWPLWGGTEGVIVDERIARQLIDHVIALQCDSEEIHKAQEWLKEHVGRSHRAKDLGLID